MIDYDERRCLVASHKNQPMGRVCIKGDCSKRGLICYDCQRLQHKTHNTISVQEYHEMLVKSSNLESTLKNITQLKHIIKTNQGFTMTKLHSTKQILEKMFISLQNKTISTFSGYITSAENIMSNKQRFEFQMGDRTQQTQDKMIRIRNNIDKYRQNEAMLNKAKTSVSLISGEATQFQLSVCQVLDLLCECLTIFNQKYVLKDIMQKKTTSEQLEKEIVYGQLAQSKYQSNIFYKLQNSSVYNPVQEYRSNAIAWVPSQKLSGISIEDDAIVRKHIPQKIQPIGVILNQDVWQTPDLLQKWIFKIVKMDGIISLGLCKKQHNEQQALKANYVLKYWLSSDGTISDDKIVRRNREKEPLYQGDNIEISYCNGILVYRRNNSTQLGEIKVTPSKQGESYRPCVCLSKINDSVKIVKR